MYLRRVQNLKIKYISKIELPIFTNGIDTLVLGVTQNTFFSIVSYILIKIHSAAIIFLECNYIFAYSKILWKIV